MRIGGDLYPLIALDEIDEPTNVESLVITPVAFLRKIINMHFEKEDLA